MSRGTKSMHNGSQCSTARTKTKKRGVEGSAMAAASPNELGVTVVHSSECSTFKVRTRRRDRLAVRVQARARIG